MRHAMYACQTLHHDVLLEILIVLLHEIVGLVVCIDQTRVQKKRRCPGGKKFWTPKESLYNTGTSSLSSLASLPSLWTHYFSSQLE